jgi:hypothetical protein
MQITSSGQGAADDTVRDNRFEFTSQDGLAVCLNVVKSSRSSPKQKALAMRCICRFIINTAVQLQTSTNTQPAYAKQLTAKHALSS